MIFLNGRMVAEDEARIDPADRGFLLGDGLFETLRSYDGRPALVEAARAEFLERRGSDFEYAPLLGDRDPPLDYRASVVGGSGNDRD